MSADRFERRKQASRTRILDAALALFRAQGVEGTTIEEICERADVATRTFFNHFPKRDDMVRALALSRLRGLAAILADRDTLDLVAFFDEIADYLEASGEAYRELVGTMLALSRSGTDRSGELYGSFLAVIKNGVARGDVTTKHDPQTLTDIVLGTLTAVLMNWTADESYSIRSGLHDSAVALADLLTPTRGKR
jgi:AcrR family transcriptional regulator